MPKLISVIVEIILNNRIISSFHSFISFSFMTFIGNSSPDLKPLGDLHVPRYRTFDVLSVLLHCLWSGPPGFNCWTSVAPAFQLLSCS